MKIRSRMTNFISSKNCPTSSLKVLENSGFFELMSHVTLEKSDAFDFTVTEKIREQNLFCGRDFTSVEKCKLDEELSLAIYKKVPIAMRDLLMTPIECERYTAFVVEKGRIFLYYSKSTRDYYIIFIAKNETNELEDDRVMFNYQYLPGKVPIKKWRIRNIKAVFKKYIVDQESAVEIIVKGKSILYNFQTKESRDIFCCKLFKLQEKLNCSLDFPSSLEKALTDEWINWKLSTLDYLMLLNYYSGRSFNNSSQYPVLPWTVISFSPTLNLSNSHIYRDLSRNMGMLGDKSRAENFKSHFTKNSMPFLGSFHFASHYSSPAITFQYLMRLFPFIEAYVQLFTGLDNPNRMFHSIQESLEISKHDPSDVKELIPEFFSLPEMFENHEQLNFGRREGDDHVVNKVLLPQWAEDSPYTFVEKMRLALESDWVAGTIGNWIDLIFGYKQRGKEAEKACNVFPTLSQDPSKVLEQAEGEEKRALRTQAYHWGQTPMQLFTKIHPERAIKSDKVVYSLFDANASPEVYEIGPLKKEAKTKIIGIFTKENSVKGCSFVVVSIDGDILEYNIEFVNSETSEEYMVPSFSRLQKKSYNNSYFDSDIQLLDTSITDNFPIILIRNNGIPYIVQGGYIDGTIQFTQFNNPEKSSRMKVHNITIRCLKVDAHEKFAISGSMLGEVTIYRIKENMHWEVKKQLWDHKDCITHIHISNEMFLFCTAGTDEIVNLYTHSGNLLRTFRTPCSKPLQYALLGLSPLPCIIMYAQEGGRLYCFSLCGKLICEERDVVKNVVDVGIGRNSNFCEYLAYIEENAGLSFRKLPTLEKSNVGIKKNGSIFALFENQKMMIIGDSKGKLNFVWDPRSCVQKHTATLSILKFE